MDGLWAGLIVIGAFFALLFAVGRISRRLALRAETRRKTVHIGTGLVSLGFPWLFPSAYWFLVCMTCMFFALLAIRRLPSRRGHEAVLHGVNRQSLGDIWFLAAVVALYFLSRGETPLYIIPLAVLTFSDAFAALIGTRHGRRTYPNHDSVKSWEGTAVCFATALIVILCLLLAVTDLPFVTACLIALNLALVAAIVEGIAWNGLDNILVPLATHFLLAGFLNLQTAEVSNLVGLASLIVLGFLTGLAAASVRLGILRTDAAMAVIVFAYVFWAVGGPAVLAMMLLWFAACAAIARLWLRPFIRAIDGRLVAFLCAPAAVWTVLVKSSLVTYDPVILSIAIISPPTVAVAMGVFRRRKPGHAS